MIIKRDGTTVAFDIDRIAGAIAKSLTAVGTGDDDLAHELAVTVIEHLERCHDQASLGVEEIQDAVVHVLQESGHYAAAIAYTRYRDARERRRRSDRVAGTGVAAPNLVALDDDGQRRPWDRGLIAARLVALRHLDAKAADETVLGIEDLLAGTNCTELTADLLASLADAALVRSGRHANALAATELRLDRQQVRTAMVGAPDGRAAVMEAGRQLAARLALAEGYPPAVLRLWSSGRLWIDGHDDPRRGSQTTLVVEGPANPWLVLTQAFAQAVRLGADWRRIRLILPPSILGHLERGASQLVGPLMDLARVCQPFLYCDGCTPLLAHWPFSGSLGLATYQEDFLLQQRLAELGVPAVTGPQYAVPGHVHRVAVELALNAQGLEGSFATMDQLAMGLVGAAQVRLRQLGFPAEGVESRFAIFGLARGSDSGEYLERQVLQEGLRAGIRLVRGVNLPEAACAHLGRLLG